MAMKEKLQGLLIVRLSDRDFRDQDARNQIRHRLDFIVDTANIWRLLIDFRSVEFVSSDTIGQLIMLKKKCEQRQISLALCNLSPRNLKILRMVRADEVIDLFEDRESAIESLARTKTPIPAEPISESEFAELSRRIDANQVDAMHELARRKLEGNGVPHDPIGAVEWFRKAAEQGHVASQFELATRFAFGQGVDQNFGLAMPWYRKAAANGYADAQYMVGMSYQYALDDCFSVEQARDWYRRAADQGHEQARLALQDLPSNGN